MERHIEIIGVVKRERVSPAGGISAQAGNNVTGIGIVGDIGHDRQIAGRDGPALCVVTRDSAPNVGGATGIDDGAVARGIRVQIGVDPALNGGELR